MPVEVIFPRVDMDMRTGRIGKWFAAEGSAVRVGEPLFEIETDKAAMEIEAPATGVLRGVRAADGEEIVVGAPVAWIVPEGETWTPSPAQPGGARAMNGHDAAAPPATLPAPLSEPPAEATPAEPSLIRATPLARREAARLGIDLRAVKGSGPRGRVVSEDLPRVAPGPDQTPAAPPAPPAAPIPAPHVETPATASQAPRLHRVWLGRGGGAPMVFLHGFGADMTGWRPAWASLEAGHRILGIDLPGHGRSPATGAATLAALVDAVREVLREESVERAHLVGHSLGGAVALGLAEAGVIDMRSLALIAPAGLGPEIDGDFLAGFLRAERVDSLTPWLRRLFADPQWVTPAFARAAMEKHADAAARAQQAALAGTLFPDGTQAIDLRGALARLAMPVKVIWGVRDAILPFRQSAGLPPLVALHAIPGAGHMPHLEARETVVMLLAELRRTDAAPGSA